MNTPQSQSTVSDWDSPLIAEIFGQPPITPCPTPEQTRDVIGLELSPTMDLLPGSHPVSPGSEDNWNEEPILAVNDFIRRCLSE